VLSTAVVVLGLVLTAGAATWVFAPEGPPLVSGALLLDPIASLVLASGLWLVALIAERASRHDLAWVALLCSAICAAGRWAAEGSATGNTAYLVLLLWS